MLEDRTRPVTVDVKVLRSGDTLVASGNVPVTSPAVGREFERLGFARFTVRQLTGQHRFREDGWDGSRTPDAGRPILTRYRATESSRRHRDS